MLSFLMMELKTNGYCFLGFRTRVRPQRYNIKALKSTIYIPYLFYKWFFFFFSLAEKTMVYLGGTSFDQNNFATISSRSRDYSALSSVISSRCSQASPMS